MAHQLDSLFSALSDSTRREIVALLADGDRTVGEIAARFPITRPAIAKHLKVLEDAALIRTEKSGRTRINRLHAGALDEGYRWFRHYHDFWERKLKVLKRQVEETS